MHGFAYGLCRGGKYRYVCKYENEVSIWIVRLVHHEKAVLLHAVIHILRYKLRMQHRILVGQRHMAAVIIIFRENLLKLITGHGESALSGGMPELLEKGNVTVQDIQLISADGIPEDCDILLFYQPQSDYTEEEIALVRGWLEKGGYGIFLLDDATPTLPTQNGPSGSPSCFTSVSEFSSLI